MSRPFEKLKEEIKKEILQLSFPIGQPYVTQTNTNPSTILGFGTWERVKGRVLIGLDEDDTNFNVIGKTGGSKYLQKHTHSLIGPYGNTSGFHLSTNAFNNDDNKSDDFAGYVNETGEGDSGNLQPYRVVGYMWIRTA